MPRVVNPLSKLVSADEIRALLGVNEKELKSTLIDLPIYLRTVKAAANKLDPRTWDTYANLPEDDDSLSPVQSTFADAFLTFVAFKSASLVAVALPQFGVKSLTDGKGGFTRHADSTIDTLSNINEQLGEALSSLSTALSALLPAAPRALGGMIGVITLGASDPVTG